MLLSQLFKDVPHTSRGGDIDIKRIVYDSRAVQPGDLFCCIPGYATDGHKFAGAAVKSGAAALLAQYELPFDVPQIICENTRLGMADAACEFYGHPSREMKMVGITGTNGKTTMTYMIKSIAESAGMRTGLIGTIQNLIGSTPLSTERTTPESVDLQRILRQMADAGVQLCVMEVSSHSLDQHRVHGIEYDVGVFTNLTQDHLDYHKTFANYMAAKRRLFEQSRAAVLNADDKASAYMAEVCKKVRTYGVREPAEVYAKEIEVTTQGVSFVMRIAKDEQIFINLNIPGLFSVFNAMGAAGAALELGFTGEQIRVGLLKLTSVSGRLERLYSGEHGTVLLDYAHTPDALENILKTVKSFAKARIITLFGCGGDRDRAKRSIMGEVAGRYSDMCIITSDNPRTEEPMEIIRSIEEGMLRSGCDYIIIENRREAIEKALSLGEKDDIIILAGKGHETYQEINGVKRHFDEKEIVAELLGGEKTLNA